MKKILALIAISLIPAATYASTVGERLPTGGRAKGFGETSVTSCDLWSISNNQAALAWQSSVAAGIFFENHFMIKELGRQFAAFAFPTRAGVIGAGFGYYGDKDFNEIKTGICFSRRFGPRFSAGLQFDLYHLRFSDIYGKKTLVSCELGLFYRAGKTLLIGVHIINPVPVKLVSDPAEYLPMTFCAGVGYQVSDAFLLTAEAEKDHLNPLIVRSGCEYRINEKFRIRTGIITSPWSFSFGCSLHAGPLIFDIASLYHQRLGFNPAASLIYCFNYRKRHGYKD